MLRDDGTHRAGTRIKLQVRLAMGNKILAEAWGASTKEAEFKAAEEALKKIRA
ncbi:MAG: putative dsRNA-binding protein [Cloacibacillus evryensis]